MIPGLRIAAFAFPFWIGNINMQKVEEFRASQPDKYAELMQDLGKQGGAAFYLKDLVKCHDGVVWFHPFFPSLNQADINEINRVELEGRKKMLLSYEFYRKNVPGFENSYIALSSPQLGIQGGQRVVGEYVCTEKDITSDEIFDDTIAVFPDNDNGEISARHPNVCIPYRSLVPKKIDGLLVACRAFSSEYQFNEYFNLIPHCIAMGQAAGTAAALGRATPIRRSSSAMAASGDAAANSMPAVFPPASAALRSTDSITSASIATAGPPSGTMRASLSSVPQDRGISVGMKMRPPLSCWRWARICALLR